MMWLEFFSILLLCMIFAVIGGLCTVATFVCVLIYIVLGAIFEYKQIYKPVLNKILGVVLYFVLFGIDVSLNGGFRTIFIQGFLDIVWALIGYRALSHSKSSERAQAAILALLPLACVAVSFSPTVFIVFLIVYIGLLFGSLTLQSLGVPSAGSEACVEHHERHYRRMTDWRFWRRASSLALIAFAIGAVLFLVVPRFGSDNAAGVPGIEQQRGVFPDVSLDRTGKISPDPSLLFRVKMPKLADHLYWRIDIQTMFDGTRWRSYSGNSVRVGGEYPDEPYRLEFVREWRDHRIPTLAGTIGVVHLPEADPETKISFYADGLGSWHRYGWRRSDPLMGYQFWLSDAQNPESPALILKMLEAIYRSDFGMELQVDEMQTNRSRWIWPGRRHHKESRDRLTKLVNAIVGDAATDREKADRVRDYLKTHYAYSLDRPVREGAIVEDFLFRQKFGHCEVFSTTMAVLLALLDVPVRNVTGFVSSEFRDDYHQVRSAHAHSWVEVYLDGAWVIYDPTPSGAQVVEVDWLQAIDDWFSAYQTRDFYRFLVRYYQYILGVLGALLLLVAAFYMPLRHVRRRLLPTRELYARLLPKVEALQAASPRYASCSACSLESWWSETCSPECAALQAWMRAYIQFTYRDAVSDNSLRARWRRNGAVLRGYRAVKRRS